MTAFRPPHQRCVSDVLFDAIAELERYEALQGLENSARELAYLKDKMWLTAHYLSSLGMPEKIPVKDCERGVAMVNGLLPRPLPRTTPSYNTVVEIFSPEDPEGFDEDDLFS